MADPEPLTYCFDIDGTLCITPSGNYRNAVPMTARIDRVNALYARGNVITLFTARGATSGIDWQSFTEGQLSSWGVRYHRLLMGKPHADIFIDDKAINADVFFGAASPSDLNPGSV